MPDIKAFAYLTCSSTGEIFEYWLICDDSGRYDWVSSQDSKHLFGCSRDSQQKAIRAIMDYANKPDWVLAIKTYDEWQAEMPA